MANPFKRLKRSPAESGEASDRTAHEAQQTAENRLRREASDERARGQSLENEARRHESDERARDQAAENEALHRVPRGPAEQ